MSAAARHLPPPHPAGWYVVAFSAELERGTILTRPFFGGEVVVYRTQEGRAVVSRPFCPHLGAHLGHGGRVVGETIRCPFHGFRFSPEGTCVEAYPGAKKPPKCQLPVYPSREKNGQVIAYFHPEEAEPTWEVPDLDLTGYRPLQYRTFNFEGHPQETSENSVDIGHFAVVHEYERIDALAPMRAEGPTLRGHYTMHRNRAGFSRAVTTDFQVAVCGLGYSIVDVRVHGHDLAVRTFVFATPAQPGGIDLRIALSVRSLSSKRALHPLAVLVPRRLLESIIEYFAIRAYAADVMQDFAIWKNKSYLEKPALAEGDGPVGLYRKWVKQFYMGEPSPTRLRVVSDDDVAAESHGGVAS